MKHSFAVRCTGCGVTENWICPECDTHHGTVNQNPRPGWHQSCMAIGGDCPGCGHPVSAHGGGECWGAEACLCRKTPAPLAAHTDPSEGDGDE